MSKLLSLPVRVDRLFSFTVNQCCLRTAGGGAAVASAFSFPFFAPSALSSLRVPLSPRFSDESLLCSVSSDCYSV